MNTQATSISPKKDASVDSLLKELTWRSWLFRNRFAILTVSLLCSCLFGFFYFQFTSVSGVELNTKSLQLRRFTFRRDPFTNIQLTGIRYSAPYSYTGWTRATFGSTIDPSISSCLTSTYAKNNWDLVSYDLSVVSGDARILVDLISLTDANFSQHWTNWSTQNPKKAAAFWPIVQDFASFDMYAQLPDLFEIALLDLDDKEFSSAVLDHAHEEIVREAESRRATSSSADDAHIIQMLEAAVAYKANDKPESSASQSEIESF
ncbi:MAG: hypothetical protein AAF483_23140 [Planctomycetota bacterium]